MNGMRPLALALLSTAFLYAAEYPAVQVQPGAAAFGANIQRTMSLLATSTAQHPNTVRILFYGQSITKQDWSRQVAGYLRERYPHANLEIRNLSIGGYDSPRLIRTLPHDVYAFYPDLVIFYDYGPQPEYEQMIRDILTHTDAEIAIQNDHTTWMPLPDQPANPAEEKRRLSHDRHSFEWLPELARKYGLEMIEQRRAWEAYLTENHLKPADLLADGVHLNRQGNFVMAEIVKQYLRYRPEIHSSPRQAIAPRWSGGRATVDFDGNRIEASGTGQGVRVLIDGHPPSQMPELYSITRPSDTWNVDWPALNHVGSEKPLLVEEWTAKVTDKVEDDSAFHFTLAGSKTGPDGSGSSLELFVSKSGRIVIEPNDWEGIKRARELKKVPMPVGFEIRWKVLPLFQDVYLPGSNAVVLASGLANGRHTLELIADGDPPKVTLTVYKPKLK